MGTARQGQYRWIRKSNTFQRLCVGNRNMEERNRYCQNTFKSTEVPQSQFTKTFKRSAKFSPIFKVFHGFENSCQKSRTLRTFEDCLVGTVGTVGTQHPQKQCCCPTSLCNELGLPASCCNAMGKSAHFCKDSRGKFPSFS